MIKAQFSIAVPGEKQSLKNCESIYRSGIDKSANMKPQSHETFSKGAPNKLGKTNFVFGSDHTTKESEAKQAWKGGFSNSSNAIQIVDKMKQTNFTLKEIQSGKYYSTTANSSFVPNQISGSQKESNAARGAENRAAHFKVGFDSNTQ